MDVFFVISGYVVSGSLAKQKLNSFGKFIADFYARRVVRIYPALTVCIVLVSILHNLFVPASWLSTSTQDTGLLAFFGLSNFALINSGDAYFSPRIEFNEFTHTWSLAVEEQFYLIFPILFFLWLSSGDRKTIIGFLKISLIPAIFIGSILYSWHETSLSPDKAFYLLPSRFWELGAGALLYMLHQQKSVYSFCEKSSSLLLWSGLALTVFGLIYSDARAFPFPWALASVIGSALVMSGLIAGTHNQFAYKIISNQPVVYIGKISYSLYLWHWPIFVLFRWTRGLDAPLDLLFASTLTVLAAMLSFHFIEVPFSRIRKSRNYKNKYILIGGLLAIGAFWTVSVQTFKLQPHISLSVTSDKQVWYPEDWPSPIESPAKLFTGRRIFVMGDSHAGAYSTMLRMLYDRYGVISGQFTMAGCSILNLREESAPACTNFMNFALSRIEALANPGDILFLPSLRTNRLGDQWTIFSSETVDIQQKKADNPKMRALVLSDAEQVVDRMKKMPITIVFEAPKPVFRSPPFRCSDWFNRNNPVCAGGSEVSRDLLLEKRASVMQTLRTLEREHSNVVVWDPFPVLCPVDPCSTFDADKPLFFDGDHLSAYGNRKLLPSFVSFIGNIWRVPAISK